MKPPVFVDTNIPIYAAGRPHELRGPCRQIMRFISERPVMFFTDAEVLQELLHRYLALRLWPQGKKVFETFATVMRDHIEPVSVQDVQKAADLADQCEGIAARDLLHVAVMMRLGSGCIVSADRDFDRIRAIERLDPANFAVWQDQVSLQVEEPSDGAGNK